MIVGKLCCSLVQAWESILALFPKSAHHKINQNTANAPQNDSFVFSYFQTQGIFTGHAQKRFQSVSSQGILNSFQENQNINGDHGGDCCSGTAQVCISMHHNFRYKNQHLQAELTMKLKLLHFRRINKTFKGNSCWISQEYSEALIVAHWNRN